LVNRSLEPRARIARIVLLLLVAGGVALRLIQFLANRSLWIDEAALALNLIHKSFASLAGHLDYGQMAPIGFLWLEKSVASLFGTGEAALRLVPFGAGLLGLALFAWLSWAVLSPSGAVVAVGLFAVNDRLIYYSSEVKQYSTDVAVTVALLTAGIALTRDRFTAKRLIVLAVLGTLGGWLSHPACFVLAGIGASMIATAYRRRDPRAVAATVALGGWWVVTVLPVLMLERRNLSAEDVWILGNYWKDGFPSASAGMGGVLRWLDSASWRELSYLTEFGLASWITAVLLVAVVFGGVSLAMRRVDVFLLVVAPIVLMLAAAIVHALPFMQRLMLFVLPLILLLVGEFIDTLSLRFAPWGPAVAWTIGAAFFGLTLRRTVSFLPEYRDELRPVLEAVQRRARPGDAVYVYNGAIRAFQYYQPRLGLTFQSVSLGCCSRDQWRVDVEALRRLGGRDRVWLVLSQWYWGEASFLLLAADRFGHRQVAIQAPGAAAYLYDLPEVPRQTFEDVLAVIPPDRNLAHPWQCSGGILYESSCGVP
jgi:hypothetical protein